MSNEVKIVLFDGDCNFCNTSVQFIFNRDKKGIFRFASLQSEIGKKYIQKFGLQNLDMSSMVLVEGDWFTLRSTAALRIATNLSGFWPLLGVFLIVPSFIRNGVYNFIAKRRHRLIKQKCALPTGEFKSRFLS